MSASPGSAARQAAPVFAALGHETRLRLAVRLVASGPLSISELTADADISRQAITKHLQVMSEAGLVRDTRQGREHVWELDPEGALPARWYLDQLSEQWDERLGHLKAFVETDNGDGAEN
jgi:DNA-binding transcriptional ArsR family regulator